MKNQDLGQNGEDIAENYLRSLGYRILEKNFINKIGEIDLIALEGKTVIFAEVKTRRTLRFGQPFEAVHWAKRRKLTNLAFSYLKFKFHSVDVPARFDVLSVTCLYGCLPRVEHIKNAFDAAL
jgi:putative endonuclease